MVMLVVACQPQGEPPPEQVPPAATPQPAPGTPDTGALPGAMGMAPSDDAEEDLEDAHEEFMRRDVEDAADEVRDAAEEMRRDATRATGDVQSALRAAADRLDTVANAITSGTITTTEQLGRELAHAYHALGRFHLAMAEEAMNRQDTRTAGQELQLAARSVETGFTRLGKGVESTTASAVRDARTVGGKLIQGAGWAPEEVGRAMQALGGEIEKLGREAQPQQ